MARPKLIVVAYLGRVDPFRTDHDSGWTTAGERYRVRLEDGGEEEWLLDRIKIADKLGWYAIDWECVKPY